MKSLRYYFVGNDLDDLEHLEEELEEGGISTPQIHVLSLNDGEMAKHPHLHEVQSITKLDLVHSTLLGAAVGVFGLCAIVSSAYLFNLTETVGWLPFIFLAVLVFGFCSWEGGLIGISISNYKFRRFDDELKEGKHILFVDVTQDQEGILKPIVSNHPNVASAGTGKPMPVVLSFLQKHFGVIRNT
ncbi:MAG: NAD/FAD-utilizing enzyme [Gammaproteobacteria bacterium]|nr:MAG: NAD/FAD-utilizing enzyme [Gammaproteobacteria bacterium]